VTDRLAAIALVVLGAASCRAAVDAGPQIVQPGAPGQPTRIISPHQAIDLSQVQHTAADVRFMQAMIGHHAQALEMTALVPARSGREDLRLLAARIEASQADEIGMMQSWLEVRGEQPPVDHAHQTPGAPLVPGMLTAGEMDQLAAANGAVFDELFLTFMIRHHEGALIMVDELFATARAAQDPEIFAFASDVDADQRMEIARMGTLLEEPQP
jgi:uncharacterized protein (DUF305 family)